MIEDWKTDRWRLLKQFLCSHGSWASSSYKRMLDVDYLPHGWIIKGEYAEAPTVRNVVMYSQICDDK